MQSGIQDSRRQVDDAELAKWRDLDVELVLTRLSDFAKPDPDFQPVKNSSTQRWHVRVAERQFEILTTGPKWYDTRQGRGGGGAVDLAMHLLGVDFKGAVQVLRARL